MNRTLILSVLATLASIVSAAAHAAPLPAADTGAAAAIRKCGAASGAVVGSDGITRPAVQLDPAWYIDYVFAGVATPQNMGVEEWTRLKPEEIQSISIGCAAIRDPVTGTVALRGAVYVITKAGAEKAYREFQSMVRGLVARQESFRGARGVYAETGHELALFDAQPIVVATFKTVWTGWSAKALFGGALRSCSIAGGTSPPDGADVRSGEMRCAEIPLIHGQ